MKASRILALLAVLFLAVVASVYFARHNQPRGADHITVYYTKDDGKTETPWTVSMRPAGPSESDAEHLHNTALYAATQAVSGPAGDVAAVRFPAGTHVLSTDVEGSTATVNLSADVKNQQSDVGGESAEFKSLVWTLTAIPGIDAVAVRVAGQKLNTLPGGHLEIDEPLRRSDF